MMKKEPIKGNLLYGQSGGPTAVINASAYGVITEAMKGTDLIDDIYVMRHGIQGALNEDFFHMNEEDEEQIELLPHTPGSAFGSVRYKMPDFRQDETDYIRLLYVFKKYNIRYFLFNGGNDSMDTCHKIADYMSHVDYDVRVIGVPKTIDNDLPHIDHTPGFASAAKYVANTIQEVAYDMHAYPKGKVTIVEIMGRHAGWLTAASALANLSGFGPDLIYLPEVPFSIEKFKDDVRRVYGEKQQCLIAVSEGIVNEDGILVGSSSGLKDAFGHFQLGGVSSKLSTILNSEMRISSRMVDLGTTQRCASHIQSKVDVEEAIEVGKQAVRFALKGEHDIMVTMERLDGEEYKIKYSKHGLSDIANIERRIPHNMITEDGTNVTEAFIEYALPLIKGQNETMSENGLQRFANFILKK
jgi:6-phosphofructokinase